MFINVNLFLFVLPDFLHVSNERLERNTLDFVKTLYVEMR